MAGQRSAGYCSNCNRGVSITRPQRSGFMNKMRSALQSKDDDSDWVCTKCGQPATRGFSPPPQNPPSEIPTEPQTADNHGALPESAPAAEAAPLPASAPGSDKRDCPSCGKPNPAMAQRCASCNEDMNLPTEPEATCHLCSKSIRFEKTSFGRQTTCPTCKGEVVLPQHQDDASAMTSAPLVVKMDDDPERPEISKALCTGCSFELTYPRRLTGKNVDCPSCSARFELP